MSVLALGSELGQSSVKFCQCNQFHFQSSDRPFLVNFLDDLASANTSEMVESLFLTLRALMTELGLYILDINESKRVPPSCRLHT